MIAPDVRMKVAADLRGKGRGEGSRMSQPQFYVIAGPNGVGKTTYVKRFLPERVCCLEFINADMIAQGLAPFAPEDAAA